MSYVYIHIYIYVSKCTPVAMLRRERIIRMHLEGRVGGLEGERSQWTSSPQSPRGERISRLQASLSFSLVSFFFFLRLPDVSFHPFLFRFKFLLAPLFIFVILRESRRFKTIQFVFPLLTIYKKRNVSRIRDNFSLRHVINMERLKNNRVFNWKIVWQIVLRLPSRFYLVSRAFRRRGKRR